MLSTLHNDDKIDEATKDDFKPEIITFYNASKAGVDIVDQMCSTYNCAENTRRRPMVVFYSLLNVAGINGYIIYYENKKNLSCVFEKFVPRFIT